MSDDWDFYPRLVDGAPASIYVDLGIVRRAPIPSHGHMAYVRLRMKSPRPDGLSSAEDYDALIALEDSILPDLEGNANSIFVGRNTSNGYRDFYFYTPDGDQFLRMANGVFLRFPDYSFEAGSRPDESWSTYLNFLFPPEKEMQIIGNRRVCENLKRHGDALAEARQIDHRVYLPTQEAAKQFSVAIATKNFSLINSEVMDDGQWFVDFQRTDRPREIDAIVIDLLEQCHAHGGRYDGWGCSVVN
jgi:uncharacterized protein (TIGR01619 family)